jgi:MerR family transcriptional regulator, thiopeptide resistance regulator
VDPARLVRDHLAQVEAAAAELDRRRAKLGRLVEDLDAGRVPDTPALLDAVRATAPSPGSARVLARHLDPDQVAVLQARAQALGPLAHYLLEVEWPELYRRAERHRAAWHDDPAGLADAPADQAGTLRKLSEYLELARQRMRTKEQDHA